MTELPNFPNPFNGQGADPAISRELASGTGAFRHDWTKAEVVSLLEAPLLELIDRARAVHGRHHADGVQLASLLSIKTGACPEDCKYCPQSAHYAKGTGLEREQLLDVDDVLQKAALAKEAGATRFCMGAAWREVKDGEAFDRVLAMVRGVRALDMEACVTLGMLTQSPSRPSRRGRAHRLQPQPRYLARVLRRDHHHPLLSGSARHAGARPPSGPASVLRRHYRHG